MIVDNIKYLEKVDEEDLDDTAQGLITMFLEHLDIDEKIALCELLIDHADELDCDDAFGTEGWRQNIS